MFVSGTRGSEASSSEENGFSQLFDFDFDLLMTPADVAPSPAGACGLQLSSEGIRW